MNCMLYVSSAFFNVIPDRLLMGDGDHVISSALARKYSVLEPIIQTNIKKVYLNNYNLGLSKTILSWTYDFWLVDRHRFKLNKYSSKCVYRES